MMNTASDQASHQSGIPGAEPIATTPTDSTRSTRWSHVSDFEGPRLVAPEFHTDNTTPAKLWPTNRTDSAWRPARSQPSELVYSTKATMWAKLLEDIVGICAEPVVQCRRPTFRAVDHLFAVMMKSPMPSALDGVDDPMVYAAAKEVARQYLDEHDWTTDELPQAHLDSIKANLPKKLSHFHASLMENILIEKLEEAGSLLAFTQDLVAVIEDTMFSYVHLQLLAHGQRDVKRVTETKITPILILSCLSKTDTPAESRQRLRDRLKDITTDDFAMLDTSSTLPAEWIASAITALHSERSYYGLYLRDVAERERDRRAEVTVRQSAMKRWFLRGVCGKST